METARINHIKKAIPGVTAGSVVKVSVLDPTRSKGACLYFSLSRTWMCV